MAGAGPEQRLILVTLGVEDLVASTRFYRTVLGRTLSSIGRDRVTFPIGPDQAITVPE